MTRKALARRQFIQFLAASPLFAGLNSGRLLADMVSDGSASSAAGLADTLLSLISAPEKALDVFDFQRVAEQVLPPAHYGYLATGTDGQRDFLQRNDARKSERGVVKSNDRFARFRHGKPAPSGTEKNPMTQIVCYPSAFANWSTL